MVAKPAMVYKNATHDHSCTAKDSESSGHVPTMGSHHRTMQKHEMENICLQSIWKERLSQEGWSIRASKHLTVAWAGSTLQLYNRLLNKIKQYCQSIGVSFPPTDSAVVADYLCVIAADSRRPKSVLSSTSAALSCLCSGMLLRNPMDNQDIRKLVIGLIKSQTMAPRIKTPAMPILPFHSLFLDWPENETLVVKRLRLKTMALLALTLMLRPSDVAPKATFITKDLECRQFTFSADQVSFHDTGHVSITLHGIKNDYDRDGFEIKIPPAREPKLDPATALRVYMERTALQRLTTEDNAVFLTLTKPHHGLSSASVATVLQEAINLAGLTGQGFTAKSFRPTAATQAVASGCDPNIARQVGRWKSQTVFEEHYVHVVVPDTFVDNMLEIHT